MKTVEEILSGCSEANPPNCACDWCEPGWCKHCVALCVKTAQREGLEHAAGICKGLRKAGLTAWDDGRDSGIKKCRDKIRRAAKEIK